MSSARLNVAVIMGGRASEHEVSLRSGTKVVNGLDRGKYRVFPIQICRDGRWILPAGPLGGTAKWLPADESAGATPGGVRSDESGGPRKAIVDGGAAEAESRPPAIPTDEILSRRIDVAVIALHGRWGEDGCIQGLLEVLGVPYTGSDVLGSALAMDKVRAKQIVSFHGIRTPKWMVVTEKEWRDSPETVLRTVSGEFGYPCVAKVPEEGSSFGMGIPESSAALAAVLDGSIGDRGHMMIEEYIRGTEITCSVLGALPGARPTALPLTEIVPKTSKYFDFEAKYTAGASQEITPARIDAHLTRRAQEIGVRVHEALGCGTLSRTDMIVRDGEIYYLETNTIPGMTETSLFPQAAAAAGISFGELLDRQIELALAHHGSR